jgi:hypothetical protein
VKSMPCYLDKQERPRASLCVFHSTVLDMLWEMFWFPSVVLFMVFFSHKKL